MKGDDTGSVATLLYFQGDGSQVQGMEPGAMMNVEANFDPYREPDFERILKACVPLSFAVNSLNRGMGRKDLYPFVVNSSVREKLEFVHGVVRGA